LLIILAALFLGAILLGALFPGVPSSDVKVSGFILVGLMRSRLQAFGWRNFPARAAASCSSAKDGSGTVSLSNACIAAFQNGQNTKRPNLLMREIEKAEHSTSYNSAKWRAYT
jgi:hypothetical protein